MAEHLEPENESSDERLHLIGDYINGHMNSDEKMLFEQQLELDAELAAEYKMQLEIATTVKRIERAGIKSRINELIAKDYPETSISVQVVQASRMKRQDRNVSSLDPEVKTANKSNRQIYTVAALLAIALIGSSLVYIYLGQITSSEQNQIAENPKTSDLPSTRTTMQDSTMSSETGSNSLPYSNSLSGDVSPTLLAETTIEVDNFSFSPTGFGFANGKRSFNTLFYPSAKGETGTLQSAYKLSTDTLHLYIGNKPAIRIFELTRLQVNDADIDLQAGVYLLLENIIYFLKNDGSQHPLVPVEQSTQDYLIKYI